MKSLEARTSWFSSPPAKVSNFFKVASQSQLPFIDGVGVKLGDTGYTLDDGGYWVVQQPTAPPGAPPIWSFVDILRGPPGPQGETGYGLPGPAGQIGPAGLMGGIGPQGPAGKSSISYLSQAIRFPAVTDPPLTISVNDTSWMAAGMLLYLPGGGTVTEIGSPIDQYTIQIANSGDPANMPAGTMIAGGTTVSAANMRGPAGPQGNAGPSGPPGPQGVAGASAFSNLIQALTIPPPGQSVVAFLQDVSSFSTGLIVYVEQGDYFSVQSVNPTNNTMVLVNQNYPGGATPGSVIPVNNTVSGTGPQGPVGIAGPAGPQGPQGVGGVAPTGAVMMFAAGTAPGGWLICDGSSVGRTQFPNLFSIIGTQYGSQDSNSFNLPNFQLKMPFGAGAGYALAATGGEMAHALTLAEEAQHSHLITDPKHSHTSVPGHTHAVGAHTHPFNEGSGHNHGITDPGHFHIPGHTVNDAQSSGTIPVVHGDGAYAGPNTSNAKTGITGTQNATTGASIGNSTAFNSGQNSVGDAINPSATGITGTQNAGSGAPHNNLPPFLVVNFIIKT